MAQLLGTVLASPVVQGNSDIDSYGTHYSFLGVGGYQEFATLAERDAILINPSNNLGLDGLSSGRRRFGMLVYVAETDIVYQLKPVYATWTGLTNTQKVAELADNNNWVEFSSGGGGDAIKKKYTEPSHGFSIGDVVAFNGTNYVKKLSASGNEDETLGMVSAINDVNNFTVTYSGFIDISSITGLSANTVYYSSAAVAGAITPIPPSGLGEENRPILITQTLTTGVVVQYRGQLITENQITGGTGGTSVTGVIGVAEDGTYTDGLFTDFIPTTPIGTAVDRFNEVLKALSPVPPPILSQMTDDPLPSAKLSFGITKNDTGYVNVDTSAGNSAIDINESYVSSGTRLGVTNTHVIGELNDQVTLTPSYGAGAFIDGDQGELRLYVNNNLIGGSILPLTGTTGAVGNSFFNLSALSAVTFSNGNPLDLFKYRSGTFTVPASSMINGFNYARIYHSGSTFSRQTNYLEWVYDPNANGLSVGSTSMSGLILTGSKYISGVRYATGGSITYNATVSNAYRNLYPNGNAISYPSRTNLSDATLISKTGTGLTSDVSASKTFPALNTGVTNPQLTPLVLASTHTIQNNVLGNLGTLGKVETNLSIVHPLKTTLTGGVVASSGYLLYSTVQSSNLKTENFTGEVNRIQNNDYTSLTYANIDGGTYVWTGSESLVGASPTHNTGLLIFNGELLYPNAPYLNTQYGINAGNFGGLGANILPGSPNYSTASGTRVFNRKFKSTNTTTQSTLTIEFLHTGSNSSFLTNGGTGGTPTGNFIKVECMIKRSGGATHGYFNPFASTGNPEGISNTAISTIGGGTSVTCTLSTVPRVGNGDIVIVRVLAASGWTNRISNINIVNI